MCQWYDPSTTLSNFLSLHLCPPPSISPPSPPLPSLTVKDPLVYHGMLRVRVGYELMKAMAAAHSWAAVIALPVLIVHGEQDTLCSISGSRKLMGSLGSADKTLIPLPGLMHEVFNERSGLQTVATVGDWLLKQAQAL